MGLIDNFRNFFSNSKNEKTAEGTMTNWNEKEDLCRKIDDLALKIQLKNSFDSSVRNLSSYTLRTKSLDELKEIYADLKCRLAEIDRESKRVNARYEEAAAHKWTGEKPKGMTDHDFGRWQRGDDR